MSRLLFALLMAFSLRSDAAFFCDWTGIEIDRQGCVGYSWYAVGLDFQCSNMPKCFKLEIVEDKKKKEYFLAETSDEKKKIVPILDSSAVPLLKNSKLKNIKIIFYNNGKLSKDFQKDAEQYLLDKGVKREQFVIEIR